MPLVKAATYMALQDHEEVWAKLYMIGPSDGTSIVVHAFLGDPSTRTNAQLRMLGDATPSEEGH